MNVHFLSKTTEWSTPQDLFDELDAEFHFTLDPCATKENAKCEKYYTKLANGLSWDWSGETVFMNPPYGRVVSEWVKKASEEGERGTTVVCLLAARTDTRWFHDYIYGKAEIRFIKGRINYGGEGCGRAPFPSMVVIFRGGHNG